MWVRVAGLMFLASFLRLLLLARKSFWLDEAISFYLAQQKGPAFRHVLWTSELNMSLYYVMLHGWLHFGFDEFHIRLLSVIPAVLTVPVVYVLGARLWSRRAGLWAALLLTVNAGHVAYAQEARAYALVILLISLSSLFFVRGLGIGAKGEAHASGWDWAGYTLCSAAAVYSQFFAVFVIWSQWLSLAALRERRLPWRWLIAAAVIVTLAIVPAAWFALRVGGEPLNWIQGLNFSQVFRTLSLLAGTSAGLVVFLPLWWIAGREAFARTRPQDWPMSWSLWFLLSWLWVPFGITVLFSLHKPFLQPRFLLVSMPAAMLTASIGFELVRLRRKHAWAVLALTILISLGGVVNYYVHQKQDWRGATAYMLRNLRPSDGVFVAPRCGPFGFDYYQLLQPHPNRIALYSTDDLIAAPSFSRIWVLSCPEQNQPVNAREALFHSFKLVSQQHFFGVDIQLYRINGAPKDEDRDDKARQVP
jgi:uncharacterized membrane protein